jgi:hypothetical protein
VRPVHQDTGAREVTPLHL